MPLSSQLNYHLIVFNRIADGAANMTPPAQLNDFSNMFGNIVAATLGLGGILLFIFLLIGGFRYITSGGDPKNVEVARNTITYAIFGLLLAASAVLIMNIIAAITGQDQWSTFLIYRP